MQVRTACPLDCWDTCTILATVENGRVTRLEGDPQNPITRGFLCPKAGYQLERTYSPNRILQPLLKTASGHKPIACAHATSLISEKLSDALSQHGSESIFLYEDAGSMGYLHSLNERLFNLLGGVSLPSGSLCWAAGIAAQKCDFGDYLAHDPLDLRNARTIVIWGRDPAFTNIHLLPILKEARQAGARAILIDPIRTKSASFVDAVLQLKPGTDAALALAAANLICSWGMADSNFLYHHSRGFDAFRALASQWTVGRTAQVTGLSPQQIEAFARIVLRRPTAFVVGYGVQRHQHGGKAVRAIDALGAVLGSVGVEGGGVNYASSHIASQLADLRGKPGSKTRYLRRVSLAQDLDYCEPRVEVAFFARANPLSQSPDARAVTESVRRIPFKVCLDMWWSDTAREADLVLPVATFLEQENIHSCSWHPYMTVSARAIEPLGEALPDWQIFSAIANSMGVTGFPERTALEWIETALLPVISKGLIPSAKDLVGETIRFPGTPQVAWADRAFKTQSGKFEFYSQQAEVDDPGSHGLCGYVSGLPRTGEFRLLARRHRNSLHSQYYEKVYRDGSIEVFISSLDSSRLGILDGQAVVLTNRLGSLRAIARTDPGVPEGVLYAWEGGSHRTGQCLNVLTPAGPTDLGLGSRYSDCQVSIDVDTSKCNKEDKTK